MSLLLSLGDSLKTLQLASQSSCSWTNELILLGRVDVDSMSEIYCPVTRG